MASLSTPSFHAHQVSGASPPFTPNPVSRPFLPKVTAVLSSSIADYEFRQNLELLDERSANHDSETRRQLRFQLQGEVIECNGEIINDFGKVADQLRRIGSTLDHIHRGLQGLGSQFTLANDETVDSLRDSSTLISRKTDIEIRQHVLLAFKDRFLLRADAIAALTAIAEPIGEAFFAALVTARRILRDCEILLGLENQTLGLGLVEQVSKELNQAYQRLHRWTQLQFKLLNLENPQMNSSIRRALRVLAERPSLFQSCLSSFAEARKSVISDSFMVALTGSLPGAVNDPRVKAIDMVAHDPLRYVGDMLAWTHSVTVSEREGLEALFVSEGDEIARGLRTGKESELWHLAAEDDEEDSDFDPLRALNELVDQNMAGVVRLLHQRAEQVIQSNEDLVTAYQLANLMRFYQGTFSKLLGAHSTLLDALSQTEAEAIRQFRFLIRDHVASLQGDFQRPPGSLSPPGFLLNSLRQLTSILHSLETSIYDTVDRECEVQPILDEAFEPYLSGCENMAGTLAGPASNIFIINCYLAAILTLEGHELTLIRARRIRDTISRQILELVEFQYNVFRRGSGLNEIFDAIQDFDHEKGNLRLLETIFDPNTLSRASSTLNIFLPSALMDAAENLKPIQEPSIIREITEQASARFCDDYARVEEYLTLIEPSNEEALAHRPRGQRKLFPRTAGEVRVLLS